jgi:hypothetical protein
MLTCMPPDGNAMALSIQQELTGTSRFVEAETHSEAYRNARSIYQLQRYRTAVNCLPSHAPESPETDYRRKSEEPCLFAK